MDFSQTDDDFVPSVDVFPLRNIFLNEMKVRKFELFKFTLI